MELTLDQALQKGVEAHKAGQCQEADRYYTAILKANPKHPDANHNMGVLAVGIGKVEAAIPFFKTALEANPKIAQFWLSYIDALIKLDRITDAKGVFDQAKSNGAMGDVFDQLEDKLFHSKKVDNNEANHEALQKAKELRENGLYNQAIELLLRQINLSDKDPNIPAILSHCYILDNNLEKAKFYLNRAKKLNVDNALVGWNEARFLLNQNKISEALDVAKKTNKIFPDDIEGMVVLGSCLRAITNFDESLKYLNKAIQLNPNYAEALINRALISLTQGDKINALSDLEKAFYIKPHMQKIWGLVLNLKIEFKEFENAIILAEQMMKVNPFNEIVIASMALCFQYLKQYNRAILFYKKVLDIKPDYLEAWLNLGSAFAEQDKQKEAVEAYTKALAIKSDYAEAYYNMGIARQRQGKLEIAVEAYRKALAIKPDYTEAYYNMGITLKSITFKKRNEALQKTICSLIEKEKHIRPNEIARAAISLLKLEPKLQKHLQVVDHAIIQNPMGIILDLSALPLLLKLMSVCPLPDIELEALLTNLRFAILSHVLSLEEALPELIEFQTALALQCFTNEYIYNHNEKEKKILKSLDASVRKTLKNNNQPSPQIILALASYQALNKYDWKKKLVLTDHIKDVFRYQFEEPSEEARLKQGLPILGEITDGISSKVRAQYEKNPYPRWVNLGLHSRPMSISDVIDEINLKLHDKKITEIEKPEILIAGCGTGQHSIGTASRFKSSKILAIDLSLSSLAYAKRKTKELNIENINYMQADILNLDQLNKKFDIIESTGVLHHMDNPLAGWQVLTACLKPGGLMKIGLYSELARKHIGEIRNEINWTNTVSSNREIKAFRDTIMKSDKDHHKLITRSTDFYSLSTLKDLLFHVQEHQFTIPKLKDHLDKLGLQFCGFEDPQIVLHFKNTTKHKDGPYNLDRWQVYEEANPQAFAGMYQFWCQKIDCN